MMATWPLLWTERKWWCSRAAMMASSATLKFPSVLFGNRWGADNPDASSRWTCDSVVRADRAPAYQIADVLRRDRVEELGACRHAELVDAEKQVAGDPQPLIDAECSWSR